MGWLDKLIRKITAKTKYADMLNGYTPIFTQFGQNIYASDVVQQAVNCIVTEMKKLSPQHIRQKGLDVTSVNSSVQRVLDNPNEIMTTSEFIEKTMWMLMMNYNAFIIPCYKTWKDKAGNEQREYTGLYPVQPVQVDFIQDASDRLYIKMRFQNNYETTLLYSDVIHIKYRFSVNEFMGGNEEGQPDNKALLKTLQLNEDMLTGVSKAMKSSFIINGVVKYKTLIDGGKTEEALKELERKLKNSESGFLPLDIASDFTPIKRDVKLVDADTLKFIDEKILRHFGVPLSILTGDYNKEQYESFYQKSLEPLIIAFSQAFTKTLFTERERSFGNKVRFYPKELVFMTVSQTLEMIRLLGDSGAMFENEKRNALGMKPSPELEGIRKQSLNYIDVDIARQYQMNNANVKTEGEDG